MSSTVTETEYMYLEANGNKLIVRKYEVERVNNKPRPALVIFFGGGWQKGTIEQFRPQSEYLAKQGIIVFTPEYRVYSKHQSSPSDCVADAMYALRWVAEHAEEFGIDQKRIAVGGGSAGGHLALCTAILQWEHHISDGIRVIPKALVLFNPVCDTSVNGFGYDRIGEHALQLSPIHHVRGGLPPMLIMHGKEDIIVPYEAAHKFSDRVLESGGTCELIAYEGRGHGFFNKGRSIDDEDYYHTLQRTELFLREALS